MKTKTLDLALNEQSPLLPTLEKSFKLAFSYTHKHIRASAQTRIKQNLKTICQTNKKKQNLKYKWDHCNWLIVVVASLPN